MNLDYVHPEALHLVAERLTIDAGLCDGSFDDLNKSRKQRQLVGKAEFHIINWLCEMARDNLRRHRDCVETPQ